MLMELVRTGQKARALLVIRRQQALQRSMADKEGIMFNLDLLLLRLGDVHTMKQVRGWRR
jgi:hypothetical protein